MLYVFAFLKSRLLQICICRRFQRVKISVKFPNLSILSFHFQKKSCWFVHKNCVRHVCITYNCGLKIIFICPFLWCWWWNAPHMDSSSEASRAKSIMFSKPYLRVWATFFTRFRRNLTILAVSKSWIKLIGEEDLSYNHRISILPTLLNYGIWKDKPCSFQINHVN